ncbi:hypothetical protein SAMN05192574_101704 [Mucilaginibacter gossypiicola]|uniref:Uncharacterized protein n=2 Tax=Mucilaginibacter TaxID=423349 RepID=A0A1H8B0H4_9SPHI|nr:hypothetical protein [Mucilaginibacter gossypiicola]SEM75357.1 hypothetical protein SAMN05192574_101704 [Mucilaginibacter gossypiicola]
MFKKIRSDRDPRDTAYSELKKEFAPYLDRAKSTASQFAAKNTKAIFWVMVASMLLSVIIILTSHRSPHITLRPHKTVIAKSPVTGGFQQIMATGNAIQEMLALRKMIDSLSEKKQLTSADSARLDTALDSFQKLNHKFNQRK